ncbi:MAG TPA: L,D-transpeptidase [Terriglobales bacterium]|nr:L,D-transpeptidase [Terriglobales bacterium]
MQSVERAVQAAGRKAALAAIAVMMAVEATEAQPKSQLVASQEGPTRDVKVLVSIPDRKLALLEGGKVTRVFLIAVGKENTPSPAGQFAIVSRVVNPTYYHPGVVIPAGPQNPLGTRWIGLDKKGFGIHGTNEPHSIGKAASHGCIRMRRADLEQLFALVRPGDAVIIRGERDAQLVHVFGGAPSPVITADVAVTQAAPSPSGN